MEQITLFPTHGMGNPFSAVCDCFGVENNTPAWPDRFGEAMKTWFGGSGFPAVRTLSLFSGAGGLDIGFSDVGFDIVCAVELEKKFCKTMERNMGEGRYFKHSTINCADIREFSGGGLGPIDFIIGGPPCQTFSAAGRRANGVSGTTDARGRLFLEYVRLLKELSPKGFLFENVYGIIGAQGGAAWKEILQAFSNIGYTLYFRIVDAADYGVPQHRERLIIVGLKEGAFKFPRPTHGPDSIGQEPFYNAGTALEGVVSRESAESNKLSGKYAGLLDSIPPGLNYSFYTEKMGHPNPVFAWRSKFSDFLYKADPNAPVRTIKASGGAYTGPLHWENRFFSYEEYKRLQTFPDHYEVCGKKQTAVKQIGNSVPPQLARIMAIAIQAQVFGTRFPFELPLLEDSEPLSFRKRKRELTKLYQKKAEAAIQSIKDEKGALPASRVYHCALQPNFKFYETEASRADFKVTVTWETSLSIVIADPDRRQEETAAKIVITARSHSWTLGVDRVILLVNTGKPLGFTAAWKAFERELSDHSIKADLVQLNGYYQYTPALICQCEMAGGGVMSNVLKSIVGGENVAAIVTGEQLSDRWGIPVDEVITTAERLKELGYEIRNHSTNPQIEEGCWLIPYAFPTLNPLSVQLRKKLR